MVPGAGIEELQFGERCALFHEGRQALVELNPTAFHIWRGLADGEHPVAVAESLADQGAPLAVACGYVEDALRLWLGDGWIVPAQVTAELEAKPYASLMLSILDVGFGVEFFGAAAPSAVLDSLEPLRGGEAADHRFSVVAWRDRYLLFSGAASRGLCAPNELAPALKAALTGQLAASAGGGFLAHGGLVGLRSRRLFLSGGPGAGKSTLTLALAAAGFECLSDDIVHVDARGWMKGAPFAPTLKSGSWPLLVAQIEGLESLSVHRRADGQQVRYLPAALSHGEGRPLDLFIALSRDAEGPARLAPLSGLDAMQTLLDGAFSAAGKVSGGQVSGLAKAFQDAQCFVLHYADLPDAVALLWALADA
jgi:hypothetical protein